MDLIHQLAALQKTNDELTNEKTEWQETARTAVSELIQFTSEKAEWQETARIAVSELCGDLRPAGAPGDA